MSAPPKALGSPDCLAANKKETQTMKNHSLQRFVCPAASPEPA